MGVQGQPQTNSGSEVSLGYMRPFPKRRHRSRKKRRKRRGRRGDSNNRNRKLDYGPAIWKEALGTSHWEEVEGRHGLSEADVRARKIYRRVILVSLALYF